jgi:hypothetical protein
MINFFRKTRKKLADDNKPLKYARYAFGEIVLVMIGILLALQVNNWNQSRLDNIEGINYLLSIGEDLKRDTTYLNDEIRASKKASDSLTLFFELMHKRQDSHIELIRLLQLGDWNPSNVNIQDNTFMEMNSSGKIDLIKSVELKKAIIDYYAFRDFVHEHIAVTTENGFDMIMKLLPDITRFYNYESLKKYDIFGENDWGWINDYSNSKFKLLEASVSHFRYKANIKEGYYQNMNEKALNILVLIEDTINK